VMSGSVLSVMVSKSARAAFAPEKIKLETVAGMTELGRFAVKSVGRAVVTSIA